MPTFEVTYTTQLNLTVRIDAEGQEDAADGSWQAAQNYCQTLMGDHLTVRAEATLDGIGADTVEETCDA